MNEFYKKYKIEAEVKTPIYIGSGEILSKKNYYIDDRNQKIYIIDIKKFVNHICRKPILLDSYISFMKNTNVTFNEWIKNNIGLSVDDILDKYLLYAVDINGADLRGGNKVVKSEQQNNRSSNINCFIKNVYGRPYIPGSSIKGAIRTAILGEKLESRNINYYKNIEEDISGTYNQRNDKYNLKKCKLSKKIEKQTFNTLNRYEKRDSALNDIFSYISIGDGNELSLDSLIICEKKDFDYKGKESKLKTIVMRECLKPGTKIEFSVTLMNDAMDIENFLNYLNNNSKKYINNYIKKYEPINLNGVYIPIGGGVGYISKTITKQACKEDGLKAIISILSKQFIKHCHEKDYKIGFAPKLRKMAKFDNKLYDMGLLELKKVFNTKTMVEVPIKSIL